MTVIDHLTELHLTDHFPQVSFQDILDRVGNICRIPVQKVFCSPGNHFIGCPDFQLNSCIGTDVNEVQCWNRLRSPNICRELLNIKIRALFDKGNHKASFPTQVTLFSKTCNDHDFIGFSVDIPFDQQDQYKNGYDYKSNQPTWNK